MLFKCSSLCVWCKRVSLVNVVSCFCLLFTRVSFQKSPNAERFQCEAGADEELAAELPAYYAPPSRGWKDIRPAPWPTIQQGPKINWQQLCQITSMDELWSVFKPKFQVLTEAAVRLKRHRRQKAKPSFRKWIKIWFEWCCVAWISAHRIWIFLRRLRAPEK